MINETYQEILKGLLGEILKLTEKKAHDYARTSDTLSNFKVQAAMQSALFDREVVGSDIAFQFILVKLARLANLKGKDPQNESVRDTILDLINYVGLYHACRLDENPSNDSPTAPDNVRYCEHPDWARIVETKTIEPYKTVERCDVCSKVIKEL